MADIKQTIDVIAFGLSVGKGIFISLTNDGKITLTDIPNFFDAVLKVPDAIGGIGEVPAELGDLSNEELTEISEFILSQLPEVGDKWMVVAKGAIQIATGAFTVYNAFR